MPSHLFLHPVFTLESLKTSHHKFVAQRKALHGIISILTVRSDILLPSQENLEARMGYTSASDRRLVHPTRKDPRRSYYHNVRTACFRRKVS